MNVVDQSHSRSTKMNTFPRASRAWSVENWDFQRVPVRLPYIHLYLYPLNQILGSMYSLFHSCVPNLIITALSSTLASIYCSRTILVATELGLLLTFGNFLFGFMCGPLIVYYICYLTMERNLKGLIIRHGVRGASPSTMILFTLPRNHHSQYSTSE